MEDTYATVDDEELHHRHHNSYDYYYSNTTRHVNQPDEEKEPRSSTNVDMLIEEIYSTEGLRDKLMGGYVEDGKSTMMSSSLLPRHQSHRKAENAWTIFDKFPTANFKAPPKDTLGRSSFEALMVLIKRYVVRKSLVKDDSPRGNGYEPAYLLDLGCGYDDALISLPVLSRYVGIDFMYEVIKTMQHQITHLNDHEFLVSGRNSAGPTVWYLKADLRDSVIDERKLAPGSFDIVTVFSSLEQISNNASSLDCLMDTAAHYACPGGIVTGIMVDPAVLLSIILSVEPPGELADRVPSNYRHSHLTLGGITRSWSGWSAKMAVKYKKVKSNYYDQRKQRRGEVSSFSSSSTAAASSSTTVRFEMVIFVSKYMSFRMNTADYMDLMRFGEVPRHGLRYEMKQFSRYVESKRSYPACLTVPKNTRDYFSWHSQYLCPSQAIEEAACKFGLRLLEEKNATDIICEVEDDEPPADFLEFSTRHVPLSAAAGYDKQAETQLREMWDLLSLYKIFSFIKSSK